MEEFFASSLQAPLLTNTTGGNSNFNSHDSYFSPEFTNGYFANNTEKYLFSDSEPSATPQTFNGGTGTTFLPDSGGLPLLYPNSNLVEQKMLELFGYIEGEDPNQGGSFSQMTYMRPAENEIHGLLSPPFGSKSVSNEQAIVLQGNRLIEGETTKYNFNYSKGDQSKKNYVNEGVSNGQVKTRTRARRGQATDPHSIAERQRREKIATRLKNLQELVLNSNKIDKATMLDEAIDYVKFLQIQVKVLSMSRLASPGAPAPLLTVSQTEGSSENSNETTDIMDQEESSGLEREVVRLMESNVISAIQFLQNKGLCLVPVKLASAMSNQNSSAI